jgi:APA family basic amino acid/polyamine antiporter
MAGQPPNASHDSELQRVLGPFSATCVVVGAIIGVGIFFTPQSVAKIAGGGDLALLTWAVGGAVALAGALSFAELGGLYPATAGQYEALRDAYGAPIAFLYVFCNASAIQAGSIAIIAVVSAQNLGVAARGVAPAPQAVIWIACGLILGLTLANAAGVRWGATVQNFTVLAKVATLILLTCLALWSIPAGAEPAIDAEASPLGNPVSRVFAGLVPVLFSFGGWQQALWIGGEVREPAVNVPRAIVVGVLCVIAVYLAANWAYLRLLGYEGVVASQTLAADAVARVWPSAGRRFVAGAVALSAFGVLNAQLLTGPRLVCGMARDGRFFGVFARVHAKLRTPLPAIGLLGGAGLALLLIAGAQGVDQILNGVVLIDSCFFLMTGLAVVVLRWRRADAPRPVRVPLYPWVPLLFALGEAAVICGALLNRQLRSSAIIGVGWLVFAVLFYGVFFVRSGRREGHSAVG